MFARITATLASCLFSCPHPSFFSLSSFSSLFTCHCRFPLPVHCVAMVTVTRTLTTNTCILTTPEEHCFKSGSKLRTQYNGPHSLFERILLIYICNATAGFNTSFSFLSPSIFQETKIMTQAPTNCFTHIRDSARCSKVPKYSTPSSLYSRQWRQKHVNMPGPSAPN